MKVVADMGVPAIHLSASGPFAPDKMDADACKKLLAHLKSLGLEISAISAWGGNVDLGEEENREENIAAGKKILELSKNLGPAIWQGHVGIMPHETSDPKWAIFVDSFKQLAEHGEKVGACLALETGPEPPVVLKRLIETVGSETIRINYDPANLILWPARYMKDAGEPYDREKAIGEYQPTEGVAVLGQYIVHTHAKDALVHEDGKRQEVPLGTGWVEWPRYVELLDEAGYDGYFAIERETGDDPVGDIRRAVEFLRSL